MRSYAFRGAWTVPFPVEQVQPVLVDLERYPEWWPQILAVAKLGEDDARVLCRSALPYTLDLVLHAERRDLNHLETTITGDLDGTVRWLLGARDGVTEMSFEQDVHVTGRLLRLGSFAARPMLRWNHHRMMEGCLAGLTGRLSGSPGPSG